MLCSAVSRRRTTKPAPSPPIEKFGQRVTACNIQKAVQQAYARAPTHEPTKAACDLLVHLNSKALHQLADRVDAGSATVATAVAGYIEYAAGLLQAREEARAFSDPSYSVTAQTAKLLRVQAGADQAAEQPAAPTSTRSSSTSPRKCAKPLP